MFQRLVLGAFGATALVRGVAGAQQLLAPAQDINLPASETATNPLEWLGANSPWFAGPNVNGISADVPDNCYVDQAAYITRHGSRNPDTGAYNGWVDIYNRIQAANFTATGSLSFIKQWKTVLTNPTLQMSMESATGAKEAHDMGYALKTRYPQLYNDGDDYIVWANNYTRVLQTAQFFVRGFLGPFATTFGSVAAVTSTGYAGATGDSLSPSDSCPNFYDSSGGDYVTQWNNVWIPPVQARLQALISGNFTLTSGDIQQIPYLCGFESQITGRLSPWCDVFTDEELKQYEYGNDLRYYYGSGPGTMLEATMMLPFLNSLVGLLQKGPNINGTDANGKAFTLPKLLMTFANDGQINELATATGVFESQPALSGTQKDDSRLFIASHFVSMRGTVAFERMNCAVKKCDGTPTNGTFVRILFNDAVYTHPRCHSGPGGSCLLKEYAQIVGQQYNLTGNWAKNCNVTTPGAPTVVQGASFFTDLTSPWVKEIQL